MNRKNPLGKLSFLPTSFSQIPNYSNTSFFWCKYDRFLKRFRFPNSIQLFEVARKPRKKSKNSEANYTTFNEREEIRRIYRENPKSKHDLCKRYKMSKRNLYLIINGETARKDLIRKARGINPSLLKTNIYDAERWEVEKGC